jgi:hypothetical protein
MTELEKYQLVNRAENAEQLKQAILSIADENGKIEGRGKSLDAKGQSENVDQFMTGSKFPNYLTRSYGIRQQALYIAYYEKYQ